MASRNIGFRDIIDMHMDETTKPIRICNLCFEKEWDKSMLVVSNFHKGGQTEQVALLELGNFVTHNAKTSYPTTDDGVPFRKLYNEHVVRKKAIMHLDTFSSSTLGQFTIRSKKADSRAGEYSSEKVFYFGKSGIVSMKMVRPGSRMETEILKS
jgi:hypothetical protein